MSRERDKPYVRIAKTVARELIKMWSPPHYTRADFRIWTTDDLASWFEQPIKKAMKRRKR